MKLSQLMPGERAIAAGIEDCPLKNRLLDLGLTEGCRVMGVLPGRRGRPAAFLIRGAVIALRQRDAVRIRIRREDADA